MTILQVVLILFIFSWTFLVPAEPVRERQRLRRQWR
jgi:hypothetical protein